MTRHKNDLRRHRLQWALSQQQVADLVGLRARSVISSYELGDHAPNLRGILALQFVFGVSIATLYPKLADAVEDEVMRQAAILEADQRGRTDRVAQKTQQLLREMLARASAPTL